MSPYHLVLLEWTSKRKFYFPIHQNKNKQNNLKIIRNATRTGSFLCMKHCVWCFVIIIFLMITNYTKENEKKKSQATKEKNR